MLKNILNVSDIPNSVIKKIIFDLNEDFNHNLRDKNIALLFEKPSTRTRISFITGLNKLQANVIELKLNDLNFSRSETIEDTFKTMNCYLDGLIYRTQSHKMLVTASNYFEKPIINALSDVSHPCQAISDFYTLYHHFNKLDLNICWFGDLNNVLFSFVEMARIFNQINLFIFSDKNIIKNNNWKISENIKFFDAIDYDLLKKADCIMTDVHLSMNDKNDHEKIKNLSRFIVNKEIMDKSKDQCVFMHCLPAKIGMEVTKEVIESKKSIVWKQAYNRLPSQMRLMQCINW